MPALREGANQVCQLQFLQCVQRPYPQDSQGATTNSIGKGMKGRMLTPAERLEDSEPDVAYFDCTFSLLPEHDLKIVSPFIKSLANWAGLSLIWAMPTKTEEGERELLLRLQPYHMCHKPSRGLAILVKSLGRYHFMRCKEARSVMYGSDEGQVSGSPAESRPRVGAG